MTEYNLNIIGDRFDKEKMDKMKYFRALIPNPSAYQSTIRKIKNLPASYGIAIDAMIREDGQTLAKELGDSSLASFGASMIPDFLKAIEDGELKPVNPEKSAREFNRPLTVLNRMGEIAAELQAANEGRAEAIKDAETKMNSDIRDKKRELKADKSYSRNPFKRWAHRRRELSKFEANEKAKHAKFCREQKAQGEVYNAKLEQYQKAKESGKLFGNEPWVDDLDRFVTNYETQLHLKKLSETPLTEASRYYEDAQAIKHKDLDGRFQENRQVRGSVKRNSAQKTITVENPMRNIHQDEIAKND